MYEIIYECTYIHRYLNLVHTQKRLKSKPNVCRDKLKQSYNIISKVRCNIEC